MSDAINQNDTSTQVNEAAGEATETTAQNQEFDNQTYVAVKGLIQRLSVQLDELKVKQKDYKERLKNIIENDTELSTYEEQAEQATQQFKKRKQEIMERPESREAQAKLKEIAEEMRDIQESLTNNLLVYFQITGTSSFETPDGNEREFKLNARLLPQKNK